MRRLGLLMLALAVPALAIGAPSASKAEKARARLEAAQVEFTAARFVAAAQAGELETVKLFLAAGMDPSAANGERFSALGLAVAGHKDAVVQVLLAAGARVSDDALAASPLGLARLSMNRKAEALLLKRGAVLLPSEEVEEALRARGSGAGRKQIFEAIEQGRTELVALQIKAGIDVNVDLFDGNTPLHIAAGENRLEIARLLIQAGANVNARNAAGTPVIGYAIVRNHEEMVKLLTEAGAEE